MADTYTVVKGDTLSEIAERYYKQYGYSGTYAYLDALVDLNDIKDPDRIVVGQVIKLSGSPSSKKKNTTNRAVIDVFGLQSNTDNTLYITWTWSKDHTENYQVKWHYDTGDNVWFAGNESTTEETHATYSIPANAKRVKVKVKPNSKKVPGTDGDDIYYWTASWSTERIYDCSNNPPITPGVPTVAIEKFKLTATLDNLNVNATGIQFQIVKNNSSVFNTGTATIKTGHVSYSCTVDAGGEYKVRCRSVRGNLYSNWTDYSSNYGTVPAVPDGILELKALSETSVYIDWQHVANAESYNIEYTTQKRYFDSSSEVKNMTINDGWSHAEITGLETGEEYFFRVRAVNENGNSGWTEIKSIVIGKDPAPPTTWSSTTTAITGEPLNLYWVHNSEDGSSQTYAELELYIDGVKETYNIKNSEDEEEKDKTSVYSIDTSEYVEGTKIQWRVRTAGITKTYGDWSVQRSIDIYAPPTLSLSVTDSNGELVYTLTSLPIHIYGLTGPNTQAPIGYHLSVIANENYMTIDNYGNKKNVNKGESVYSQYFDITTALSVDLSAHNVDLENNIEYTVVCTASMNSGLSVESSMNFKVAWTDEQYEPNAEIGINKDRYTASIMPYCMDENGQLPENISLSVYRREYDGSFTELATNIANTGSDFIVDPHPALDFARYRIVAITEDTGSVSYYDVPGIPVNGDAVIIQWSEEWTSFNALNEDAMEESEWSGSMLKLPYNIDTSENNSPDVALIEYSGRKHPVSYYGTQLGTSATWNVVIEKDDKETVYALRRLQLWMGDVYVREPSGCGYWANIKVSFSQKHSDVTIPVTLEITRVAGGV